jgi:4-alpha-glucanotransferase
VSRASGILLHPTSLPGPYGIGDLGPAAYKFVDFLVAAGQTCWQILPLGPTGYGDSPYQTLSAFAGNPLLISPELLVEDGLLPPTMLDHAPPFPAGGVDYGPVIDYKKQLLEQAFVSFEEQSSPRWRDAVQRFAAAQQSWLDDFALFMALKDAHDGAPWMQWEPEVAARQPAALAGQRRRLEREIRRHIFVQYLFFRQWIALKEYVSQRGVRVIGDAPIFAAHDSADCWAHRELFYLAPDGRPTLVAGVPPDYFSATGQLWGNPLYRWDVLAATGYAWWIDRLRTALSLVDVLRLDHFRGFAGYWAIPGDAPTAETGTWEPGPGACFFTALQDALGSLPFIAEDLGVITPDVVALRERFGFPGMTVLQFAFDGDATSSHLPHNYSPHCVVYTGTHDNDTATGWFATAPPKVRAHALGYMASDGDNPTRDLIRLASASVAETAIAPLQDLLGLGSEARMNRPGQSGGNWRWRYVPDMLTEELARRARTLGVLYGRAAARPTASPGCRTRPRRT